MLQRLPWAQLPFFVSVALGLVLVSPSSAQHPLPVGGQFQVNTSTTSSTTPSLAMDSDGRFVVTWSNLGTAGTDNDARSIQGQRYDADGALLGPEFQVNTYTTDSQSAPDVSTGPFGEFVVVWTSDGSPGYDQNSDSVQGQRYDLNGTPDGGQFQINSFGPSCQREASVAVVASNGAFVVAWTSCGPEGTDPSSSIQGQRYGTDGSPAGTQFQVNTYTTGSQTLPDVGAAPNGDFVVVWQSLGSPGTDTSSLSVQGQRYASNGSPQGPQFQVNTSTTQYQNVASVAVTPDGDFMVAWQSAVSLGGDTSYSSVQGQRFASSGSAQGAEFQVNTDTAGFQTFPDVTADADGAFVVVWEGNSPVGPDANNVRGQRYDANGSAQNGEFLINTFTTGNQSNASVASTGEGLFTVVWQDGGSVGNDPDTSIQGQRFQPPIPVPALSPSAWLALGALLLLTGGIRAFARSR